MNIWKDIPGYAGAYQASINGEIKNSRSGFTLKPWKHPRGYVAVTLSIDGKKTKHLLHKLVLLTFVGPCPPGQETLHLDDNKVNNGMSNLRYGTPKENRETIKYQRGTSHSQVRLTDAAVRNIRLLEGTLSKTKIAERFGVSLGAVQGVLRGNTWSWLA